MASGAVVEWNPVSNFIISANVSFSDGKYTFRHTHILGKIGRESKPKKAHGY